ncbi:hypothetical protein N7532_005452 [Penicillium argentinense]|uniref:tRNA(Ile)-lysidine synthetase n=1 Tax=Penicillium argentinense TaxID=1131581 RepID=A0A9W9FDX9_9EURO|nr:uncharacterized protein N7532_005452 [Penicillium argentinense]KAJ5098451.1 hypothetical protein N7532_005452 [Penicillium argentinense]
MASNIISPAIFAQSLRRAWLDVCRTLHYGFKDPIETAHLPHRVGLAVSGGADSMCLAYLCRQLERSGTHGSLSVTAFVVDHRAREESKREAQTVAGWLRNLGVETNILELDWSPLLGGQSKSVKDDADAKMPSAFETHARRLRFQALGIACRDRNIETLLMGHHQDDAVETTILRLSAGARGAGLAGIQAVARIPECHGIFGVSQSGSSIVLSGRQRNASVKAQLRVDNSTGPTVSLVPNEPNLNKESTRSSVGDEPLISTGGVYICRPFLGFPKKSLLDTCHRYNIPYVSDPTNFDPTLTARNTVRSLLSSGSLPRALQSPSILSLSKTSNSFIQASNQLTDRVLSAGSHILDLNLRCGSLVVEFLSSPELLDPLLSESRAKEIKSLALRRITELISSFHGKSFPLRSFEPYVSRLFDSRNNQPRHVFTLAGCMFTPLTVKPVQNAPSALADLEGSSPMHGNVWLVTRQPYMKNRAPFTRIDLAVRSSTTEPARLPMKHIQTSWTLWDDRFWLRVSISPHEEGKDKCLAPFSLFLRPFQKTDLGYACRNLDSLTESLSAPEQTLPETRSRFNEIRKILTDEAPGSIRYTIPVLGMRLPSEKSQSNEEVEHLLALPTLGAQLCGRTTSSDNPNKLDIYFSGTWWTLRWEWMYKEIDVETVRLMGGPLKSEAKVAG